MLKEALARKKEAVALRAANQHERAAETRNPPPRSRRTPRSIPTERAPPADAVGSIGAMPPGYFEGWRVPQVLRVYGKSRASLYGEVRAGTFPAPFKSGETTLFDSREVLAEMERRKAESRKSPPPKKIIQHTAQPATIPAPPTAPKPSQQRAPARRRRSK